MMEYSGPKIERTSFSTSGTQKPSFGTWMELKTSPSPLPSPHNYMEALKTYKIIQGSKAQDLEIFRA
jgi:hypothetical protein